MNYVVIHSCDSMWSFEWKQICAYFFSSCAYICIAIGDPVDKVKYRILAFETFRPYSGSAIVRFGHSRFGHSLYLISMDEETECRSLYFSMDY